MKGRVLTIAGSDSGAGAGIQADVKSVMAMGGYCMTALTALTAQNTLGVHGVVDIDPAFVRLQMECVLADIGVDAFKTGMLSNAAIIEAVADVVAADPGTPLVLDPVLLAKGGHALLAADAVGALIARLAPLATVITPNVPEAEALTGQSINGLEDMVSVARALLTFGPGAVLIKGGHLAGDMATDVLVTASATERFTSKRIATRHTHGTGCSLASAIAAGLAQGRSLPDAVGRAHAYVQAAIGAAPGYGAGHGPLDHAVQWTKGAAA